MEFKKISAIKADTQKKRVKKTETGKPGNVIDVSPQPKSWRGAFDESTAKGAVMTFARMNPPTTGHEKLVKVLKLEAKARGYDPVLVLSSTTGDQKNPLNPQEKLELAREAFPQTAILLAKDFIDALKKVNVHYKNVTIVVGEDRVAKVQSMLKYNGHDFHFDKIDVSVAGARVSASKGVEGVSASKVRAHAHAGEMDHFTNGLASGIRHKAHDIHKMIREEQELDESLDASGRLGARQRFRSIRARVKLGRQRAMKRRASGEVIDKRARRAAKMIMRSRLLGGRKWSDMPLASRASIDKRLAPRAKAITRIAKRLAPKLRRAEYSRKLGGAFKGLKSLNKPAPDRSTKMLGMSKHNIKTVGDDSAVTKTVSEALQMVAREFQPVIPNKIFEQLFELAFERGTSVETIVSEYRMGYAAGGLNESEGFARVHSFLNGGLAARLDELAVPNADSGKEKRRVDLPQLSDFASFKADLSSNGISMKPIMVDPRKLTPTQKHFNEEKVQALKESGAWSKHPIITSNCNHVIDGHHRWLAAHQLGEKISAQQVGMDVDSLLEFCKGKDYVERKKLSESVTKPKTIAEIKANYNKKEC